MLTQEVAEAIVTETMLRLNRNINIIDKSGIVIASGDPYRINCFHEGGLHAIETGKPLLITPENEDQWKGSKLGINLPIEFQNKTIGAIGITGNLDDVQQFGDLLKMTAELMIKQSYVASQSEWRQRTIEETFEELIKEQPNEEIIEQKLELLKVSIQAPFHLLLVDIESANIKGQRQVFVKKLADVFTKNHSLVGFLQVNKLFVLTSGLSSETVSKRANQILDIANRFNIPCKIGIGTTTSEKSAIHQLYKEASLALLLNDKNGASVNSYAQIETEAFIFQADSALQQRFLNRTFPTISDKNAETLQTFFDCNLNITETANKLYIHRNTLIYRFKKVKEQTGYDPQIFHDAVTLQLASWIYKHKSQGNG